MSKTKKDTETINTSGIHPAGDRILIKPDEIEEVTKGGIVIPETTLDQQMHAQTSGTLIAIGPEAYSHYTEEVYENGLLTRVIKRKYSGPYANIGDKVMFAKYGGQEMIGKDGEIYRILNDEDITAQIEEGVTFSIHARKRIK